MAEIVKIKKDGVIQYPITKPECVIDENGKNVLQLIKENGGGSTPDLSEYLTKEEFNEASEDFATTDVLEDYATTQQLTELSAEVSGLSERIENLPSGESSVFEAVYGETTYDEIVEAVKAKKHIICFHKNRVYNLCNFQQGMDLLFTCAAAAIYTITLKITSGNWVESQYDYEIAINKVTTINENSTDTKYPSAKAVYDFVQSQGGGSEVFEAIKGETSYDEIKEAFEANKVVYCYWEARIYMLTKLEAGAAYFAVTHGNYYYRLVCYPGTPSTSWGTTSENFQHSLKSLANSNVELTIAGKTAEVATPQYVENAIQQIGGGTNEEMQRILAGNTPNLIWEDLDGKLHYEHGELASRKAQSDPTFKTTCRRLLSCSLSNTEELAFLFGVQNDKGTIEEVYPYLFAPVKLAIINFAFSGAPNIKDWSFLKLFNTSNVTSMIGVFEGASADYIDVSNWDTSNVTAMGRDGNSYPLFGNFKSIIGLNKWNVSKVEHMSRMFSAQIEDIGDVSTWDVSSCSNFDNMFRENGVIKNIDLSSWAIKSGASISHMLFNMKSVETIGFPNIANGCTTGSIGRYLDSLTSIFFKEGSTFGCSLSFNESPLTAESVKQLLAHASSTPDEGATLTFRSNLYASFSAEDKVEIDALRNVAVANGWTIVNMG